MSMKFCPSYPGYSVTDDGRVCSYRTRTRFPGEIGGSHAVISDSPVKEMSVYINKKGYRRVSVRVGKSTRPVQLAVLVLDAFVGPRPPGQVCRHLDGDNSNNKPGNLAWGTHTDNAQDRLRHGRYARGEKHPLAKLTMAQAREMRRLRIQGIKVKVLASQFHLSIAQTEGVIYGKTYKE